VSISVSEREGSNEQDAPVVQMEDTATSNAPETMGWWKEWSLAVEEEDFEG
jgi:hypothetical protein